MGTKGIYGKLDFHEREFPLDLFNGPRRNSKMNRFLDLFVGSSKLSNIPVLTSTPPFTSTPQICLRHTFRS